MNRGNAGVIGTLVTPSANIATGVFSLNQLQVAAKNGTWPPFAAPDPYFNYVTMLLPGNGTNGAQNNTFLDSSANNFTITRNGNTTQGTVNPYGNNWSNFFDGNGDFLTLSDNAAFDFGTGNFAIECFFYLTGDAALDGDNNRVAALIHNFPTSGATFNFSYGLVVLGNSSTTGTGIRFSVRENSNTEVGKSITTTVSKNSWHHIVVCRSGTNLGIFLDGARISFDAAYSLTVNDGGWPLNIGALNYTGYINAFPGYISNVRMVKGSSVYDPTQSTISVPTAPLTAITNTSLLTCQSNRFIDNSSNNFTITRNGDTSIQRFSPFNPTASYAPSVDGGSGYFDGAGDYLISPVNAALAFGSSDFCIEFWIYTTSFSSTDGRPLGNAVAWGANVWSLHNDHVSQNEKFSFWVNNYNASAAMLVSTSSTQLNTWQHVAITRSGSTWRMFVNGVVEATQTSSVAIDGGSSDDLFIGGSGNFNEFIAGYFSGLRLVKGTAVYTANFTPPTAPPTAISGTSLLLNFTNAGIIDNAEMNNIETGGGAQISTAQSKWGSGSIWTFDITSQLVIPPNPATSLNTGDFTLEFWVRFSSFYNFITIVSSTRGANGFNCGTQALGQIVWYANGAERVRGTTSMATNTWYHIAFVRSSGTLKGYLNGNQDGTTYADSINYSTPIIRVANLETGGENLNGYMQDIRVTKGYARYTANFTPPTAPFPTL
jgi:hypothetical protein